MFAQIARGGRSVRSLTFILTGSLALSASGSLDIPTAYAGEPPTHAPAGAPVSEGSVEVIAPIAEINIKGWKVDRYHAYLVAVGDRILTQIFAVMRDPSLRAADEATIRAEFARITAALEQARQEALALPPWKGDASFRDAVAIGAQASITLLDRYLNEALPLLYKQEPTYADLLAMESLTRALDAQAEQIDLGVHAAQRQFTDRNQLILLDGAPSLPEFRPPTLPPGSVLSADVHLRFVLRYHNALLSRMNRLDAAIRPPLSSYGSIVADPLAPRDRLTSDLTEANAALSAITAEIERLGPWGEDRALYDATLSYARSLQHITAELIPAQLALLSDRGVARRDHADFDARAAEIQQLILHGITNWKVAAFEFTVAEYETWISQQP